MTVRLCTGEKRYQGLSSDEKPDSPPNGSTFHIIDTGETYVFHDGTWEQDIRTQTALSAL